MQRAEAGEPDLRGFQNLAGLESQVWKAYPHPSVCSSPSPSSPGTIDSVTRHNLRSILKTGFRGRLCPSFPSKLFDLACVLVGQPARTVPAMDGRL
jgi:hypothetical protein